MRSEPLLPLSRLLCEGRPGEHLVAFDRDRREPFADLAGRVEALAQELRGVAPARFLLLSTDAYDFAVGLLALMRAGSVAVLPPNRQPGTLARLGADAAGAIAGPDDGAPAALRRLDPRAMDPVEAQRSGSRTGDTSGRPALVGEGVVAELYTSGTTGTAKPIAKTLHHLESEVAALAPILEEGLEADTRVFATVSPQHLYGLLFRVLWPLASGRAFHASTPLHPEELVPRMAEAPSCVLAATPVHLRRMVQRGSLAELRGRCRAVISSGGPLDAQTARGVAESLGRAPLEVFGSSETGGVALRRQEGRADDELWTPFGPVAVSRSGEGLLRVRSPFVSDGSRGGPAQPGELVLGDRIELADGGRFRLVGRADRVAKIGEKRVALPEMESGLREHPFVAEVALLPLEQAGQTRVAAAVVLTDAGHRAERAGSRRAVLAELTEQLAPHWDRVALPRAWRIVAELPHDARGKVAQASLRRLFEPEPGDRPRRPEAVAERRGSGRLERELVIPDDLAHLEGHFEARPVVPGVALLAFVLDAAEALLGTRPELRRIDALKFQRPVVPGDELELGVERVDPGRIDFEIRRRGETVASGRLRPREAGPS